MWAHFSLKSEDFLARYHRRSNVEATIGAIKALAGGAVRSKLPVARANEVLAKVLLHNLTCIVHAIEEFGIEIDLAPGTDKAAATKAINEAAHKLLSNPVIEDYKLEIE
jgi:hypothetical protein